MSWSIILTCTFGDINALSPFNVMAFIIWRRGIINVKFCITENKHEQFSCLHVWYVLLCVETVREEYYFGFLRCIIDINAVFGNSVTENSLWYVSCNFRNGSDTGIEPSTSPHLCFVPQVLLEKKKHVVKQSCVSTASRFWCCWKQLASFFNNKNVCSNEVVTSWQLRLNRWQATKHFPTHISETKLLPQHIHSVIFRS